MKFRFNPKKARNWVLYRICEGLFCFFLYLVKTLPPHVFRRVFPLIIRLPLTLLVPRRRIIKNLDLAFGETYSLSTKKGLARGVQEHFAKNLTDCFLHMRYPERTQEIVKIKGKENLEAAFSKGSGVIALGAHIGNFVLLGTRLAMEDYRFHALFRIPPDPRTQSLFDRYLQSFYQKVIPSFPRRKAVKRVLEVLKRNEIIFILADNLKRGKVQSQLFGRAVRSSRGPVSLALRSGAAILPMYLIREYSGELCLVIEPEFHLTRNGHLATDIVENTHRITRQLEELIRRYPDQWNWLTVRMKTHAENFPAGRTAP